MKPRLGLSETARQWSNKYNLNLEGETGGEMEKIIYNSHSYLFALEDVADHLGSRPYHLGFLSVLRQDPPPGHDDDQLSDICYVGDGAESVIHHNLLESTDIRMHTSLSQLSFYCPDQHWRVLRQHSLISQALSSVSHNHQ